GIRTPLISAPMAGGSGGRLAARVSQGGGLGFIAYGYQSLDALRSEVDTARSLLQIDSNSLLPIGIGYLGWRLESPGVAAHDLLSVALNNHVQAIWLSFGTQLHSWIDFIRKSERKPGNTKIIVQVDSLNEALVAVRDWKADVVVAQGIEAGGHGSATAPSLLTLLSEILSTIPEDGPPILGAGGIVNGAQVASLLGIGASGAVLGTRFLLSPESLYSELQRQALIAAPTGSSVRTTAFDQVRNTLGWPEGIDGRGLRNSTVDEFQEGANLDDLRRKYAAAVKTGDVDRIVTWAGASVGLLNRILPAKEIVEEIHRDCVTHLQAVNSLFE
ncbi:Nitronate monooxygenase, partial [Termitomyces sp. J132]